MVIRDCVTVGRSLSIHILLRLIVTSKTLRPRNGPGQVTGRGKARSRSVGQSAGGGWKPASDGDGGGGDL